MVCIEYRTAEVFSELETVENYSKGSSMYRSISDEQTGMREEGRGKASGLP